MFYVEVENDDTEKVVKRFGPMTERKAGLCAAGVERNLNHAVYSVRVFESDEELSSF